MTRQSRFGTRAAVPSSNIDTSIWNLSFNSTDSSLITNIGRIRVDKTKLATLSSSSKDESSKSNHEILGNSGSWVTWNGQNFLWLPPNYRASSFVVSPSGSTI